jgi:hypothetical protein
MSQGTDAVPTTDAESSYIRLGGVDAQRLFSTMASGRGADSGLSLEVCLSFWTRKRRMSGFHVILMVPRA